MAKKKIQIAYDADCNKEILFDLMSQAGVEKFWISFDGGGDDGQINEIEVIPPLGKNDKFLSRVVEGAYLKVHSGWANGKQSYDLKYDPTVKDIVEDICYNVLEQFGGWENDDGSCGEFVVDSTKRQVELTMKQRYYEYDVSEYTF